MMTGLQVATCASGWLATPYLHQAHARGLGCDCAGLVGGVAVELGIVPADWWETQAAPYAGYSRQPANGMLERICDGFMARIDLDDAQFGDVVGIRWSKEMQHLGILAPYQFGGFSLIHAYESAGAVVEHRFADVWRKRVTHTWRMPGVN